MTPAARRLRERRQRELERALEENARMEGLMEEQRAKRELAMASFEGDVSTARTLFFVISYLRGGHRRAAGGPAGESPQPRSE